MKTRMLTIRGIAVQITERENCRRFILRSRPDCPYAMLSGRSGRGKRTSAAFWKISRSGCKRMSVR